MNSYEPLMPECDFAGRIQLDSDYIFLASVTSLALICAALSSVAPQADAHAAGLVQRAVKEKCRLREYQIRENKRR